MQEDIIEPHLETQRSMDEYIHQPYWKVGLSDGQTVYSRPDRRSWLELRAWLKQNATVYITGLWVGFRDHLEEIHRGEADYFFTNSILAEYGGSEQKFYIAGYRVGELVHCKKYRIPEIFLAEEEKRGLDDPSVIRGLIRHEGF